MKPYFKALIWELCLQISIAFLVMGEISLFIGVVDALTSSFHKVAEGAIVLASISCIIGLLLCVAALFFCNRNKIWQRVATNVNLVLVTALIGKNIYLLLTLIL